jgi:glycosyltransferase involved in cell wall biosynthesis
MKILFVHQNFPGQYLHLARHLGAIASNEVVFITQRQDASMPGIRCIVYKPQRKVTPNIHHYLPDVESGVLNAQAVMRVALDLKASGFTPDVMLGHNGWGEIWYLKDVYPDVPLIGYFEFYYRLHGADIGFDPSEPEVVDTAPRIRSKNLGNMLALEAADLGQTPTQWQKSLYPKKHHASLHVTHEGINTQEVQPDPEAWLHLKNTNLTLTRNHEVVTYVSRNLEPYRGFYSFMRSLPEILVQRPNAHILIVGGDDVSYGHRLPEGHSHKQIMLAELGASLDMSRVHFLGKVPYSIYLKILQISSVHVYLTYPFVLSWSMLEAMSAECLIVGSRTPPVEEVILEGENGFLVDFFAPAEIAQRVTSVLEAGRDGFAEIRQHARRTIVENYDLNTICLPAQLKLIETALNL